MHLQCFWGSEGFVSGEPDSTKYRIHHSYCSRYSFSRDFIGDFKEKIRGNLETEFLQGQGDTSFDRNKKFNQILRRKINFT